MSAGKILTHTKKNRKYHIVYVKKYCRKIFYGETNAH